MYQSHWGLSGSPFRACGRSVPYYAAATHEEALARMHFLAEQQGTCGLLVGPAGSGKSLLLAKFAEQARRRGSAAAIVSGWLDERTALFDLASQWGLFPTAGLDTYQLWRLLADRLIEHRYQQTSGVILLDAAEHAGEPLCGTILGLLASAESIRAALSLIVAARTSDLPRVSGQLLERVELRIELEPFSPEETQAYVAMALEAKGGNPAAFDASALVRLHALSGGQPRKVGQLAELSLLAGAGHGKTVIDGELVAEACAELGGVR